jgi:hypothetical protein
MRRSLVLSLLIAGIAALRVVPMFAQAGDFTLSVAPPWRSPSVPSSTRTFRCSASGAGPPSGDFSPAFARFLYAASPWISTSFP